MDFITKESSSLSKAAWNIWIAGNTFELADSNLTNISKWAFDNPVF